MISGLVAITPAAGVIAGWVRNAFPERLLYSMMSVSGGLYANLQIRGQSSWESAPAPFHG